MSQETIISIDHISKSYGNFKAVDDLSFQVYRNEIFAMLGPNGAGKSTTIRMILDIMKPDSGRITVLGKTMNDELKNRIGYLPEERGLYRDSQVIDVMVYLGKLKGMTQEAAKRRSMELLEKLELADKAKSKVKEFSKGMQQKVQFAVTIMHQPELIIVDEPFSGLDPVNTRLIKEIIMELKDEGTGVIMSTHQMYQVEEMADRLIMINHGAQALYGQVEEVRNRFALHAVNVVGSGDFAALPGVSHVERQHNSRDGQTVFLKESVNANDLLAAIANDPTVTVERFEMAIPGLNDIFIMVAGETPEQAESAALEQKEAMNV